MPQPTWNDRRAAPDGLEAIRSFVNTRDIARGPEQLGTAADAQRWLVAHGLADPDLALDAAGFERTLGVREAFRALLLANAGVPGSPALAGGRAALNDVAVRAGLSLRLTPDGGARLIASGNGLDAALGALARLMFEAMATGAWERLRACPACGWAFYDGSRNRSSRWCDMAICGNRAKQRALRQRRQPNP